MPGSLEDVQRRFRATCCLLPYRWRQQVAAKHGDTVRKQQFVYSNNEQQIDVPCQPIVGVAGNCTGRVARIVQNVGWGRLEIPLISIDLIFIVCTWGGTQKFPELLKNICKVPLVHVCYSLGITALYTWYYGLLLIHVCQILGITSDTRVLESRDYS